MSLCARVWEPPVAFLGPWANPSGGRHTLWLTVAPRIYTVVENSLKGNITVVGKEKVLSGGQKTNYRENKCPQRPLVDLKEMSGGRSDTACDSMWVRDPTHHNPWFPIAFHTWNTKNPLGMKADDVNCTQDAKGAAWALVLYLTANLLCNLGQVTSPLWSQLFHLQNGGFRMDDV